ncbi:Na/Pi cotransporter family protein [Falsiroseomonas sp.]|uniref:Na/Pi cotransporter family protein n=1 Tax=Falsiroseomonas sp. TaxID=2870721 RepID=UPI00271E70D3|nr:Na/Pi symporter [Falsiroseomonas sp.]MDO9502090.1 Na/Pi symporter [Falsiroseomonas sp.]
MSALVALLGGLGLFLLGTWLMTEGLKLAAGGALRAILETWTRSPLRGLLAGFFITAVVRSSSAVTVAAIGFVNAGLLSLTQAVWVVFGTNVGTTTTAWLVAFVGIRFDIAALALPLLGLGMLLRLAAGTRQRAAGIGQALAGFGCFFLGIDILQGGFADLAPRIAELGLPESGPVAILGFVGLGVLLTVATQSSSAAIAIALTASAGGAVPLEMAAAAVIGTNIGTTSTALLAALGATPPARRVATAHIAFNLLTGIAALALLPGLLALSRWIPAALGAGQDMPTVLAVFHTLFNLLGVLLIWPIAGWLIRWLSRLYTSPEETLGRPQYLDATLLSVPELAAKGLEREVARMLELAAASAAACITPTPGATPTPGEQIRAVTRLGQEVRGFLAQLNSQQLPDAVAAALPHLLRAVQHAETITALAERLGGRQAEPARLGAAAEWAELRMQALEALTPVTADEAAVAAQAEAAYQAVKNALLAAAARGRTPVAALDAALLQAQSMRRIAAAVLKGRRRLRAARPGAVEETPAGPHTTDAAEEALHDRLPAGMSRPD